MIYPACSHPPLAPFHNAPPRRPAGRPTVSATACTRPIPSTRQPMTAVPRRPCPGVSRRHFDPGPGTTTGLGSAIELRPHEEDWCAAPARKVHHLAPSGGYRRTGPTTNSYQRRASTEGLCIHSVPIGTSSYVLQQTRLLLLEHERLVEGIIRLPSDSLPLPILCQWPLDLFWPALDATAGAVLPREVDARSLQVLSRLCRPLHDHPLLSAGDSRLVQL
mmetsp:Transcript_2878/g.13444  ORF Transcript_2878/g.13444 Transcript_2878/m.13444 type:complete len:219 (+) Transcript_2878:3334-3990(+)